MYRSTAQVLYDITFAPPDLGSLLVAALGTPQGLVMTVVGNLAGLGFALATLLVGTFSLARVVDGEGSARKAAALARVGPQHPEPRFEPNDPVAPPRHVGHRAHGELRCPPSIVG